MKSAEEWGDFLRSTFMTGSGFISIIEMIQVDAMREMRELVVEEIGLAYMDEGLVEFVDDVTHALEFKIEGEIDVSG